MIRKIVFIPVVLFFISLIMNVLPCSAQEENTINCHEKQIVFKQKAANGDTTRMTMSVPQYPDGLKALYEYLDTTVVYPAALESIRAEGTAMVQFVVGADGEISEVALLISSGYPEMDDEAVRVVTRFPNWTPAKKNGEAISMKTQIPIHFACKNKNENEE